MSRLPYLLKSLPIRLPGAFVHSVCSVFIWHSKHPRIGRNMLLRPKLKDGLGFSDLALYYRVVHITRVVDLCRHKTQKLWVTIEQEAETASLAGLPWAGEQYVSHLAAHPLIGPTLAEMDRFFSVDFLREFPLY